MTPVSRLQREAAHRIIDECRKAGILLFQDGPGITSRPPGFLKRNPALLSGVTVHRAAIVVVLHESV